MNQMDTLPTRMPIANPIFKPLEYKLFRVMTLIMLVSNLGTWMHELGAAWLMTTLSESALMVALVQTAATLPFFLLAAPAGVLADIADRRRYLLIAVVWMTLAAAALAWVTYAGRITPALLLALSFAVGIGNALMRPAWSACIPEWVPRQQLRAAVTLSSMTQNISRAIGPAIGGFVIVALGPQAVFALNALSFAVMLIAVYRWRRAVRLPQTALPVERFFEAMRAGVRYCRHNPPLRAVIIRSVLFFGLSSVAWPLLPSFVVRILESPAQSFGLLMANTGIGAITATLVITRLRSAMTRNDLVVTGTLLVAVSLIIIGLSRNMVVLAAALIINGFGTLLAFAPLLVAAQIATPDWVRARVLSLVMLYIMGSIALGSAAWGAIADLTSVPDTFLIAAGFIGLSVLLARRIRIHDEDDIDVTPSMQWPSPERRDNIAPERGPVMVSIHYRVAAPDLPDFERLLLSMRSIRKRSGAYFWQIFNDVNSPDHYVEMFLVENWLQHMRQQERVTIAEKNVLDQLERFRATGEDYRVRHFIAGVNQPKATIEQAENAMETPPV